MDRAGLGMRRAIRQFFRSSAPPFSSAAAQRQGDALVAAAHLADWGWDLLSSRRTRRASSARSRKKRNLAAATAANLRAVDGGVARRLPVCLDGLLGTGAKGALRGGYPRGGARDGTGCGGRRARSPSRSTSRADWTVVGAPGAGAVEADVTLTVAQVKAGLAADAAIDHVGGSGPIPPDELVPPPGKATPPARFLSIPKSGLPRAARVRHPQGQARARRHRRHFARAGRAPALCSAAALRAGAGLVTVFAAEDAYLDHRRARLLEVMVRPCRDYGAIDSPDSGTAAIGPRLGDGACRRDPRRHRLRALPARRRCRCAQRARR
ncbi:MAG: NAD(P)H-hydrate epimerase [Verrucomicrobiales bacterium]